MSFYICSTPYHILVALCDIYNKKEKTILYLTTHNSKCKLIFDDMKNKLEGLELIEKVIIRKRNSINEILLIEAVKDRIDFLQIRKYFMNRKVYNFAWNMYSIYTTSSYLYKKSNDISFFEEGASQWVMPKPSILKLIIKRYLYGVSTSFHKDNKLKEILVQYPEKYPEFLKSKLNKLNLETLFYNLTDSEKNEIINLFISDKLFKKLKSIKFSNSIIILTQPLSEDGFISEEEKINLYWQIVKEHREDDIFIKKHPREKTEYNFKNVIEFNGDFPSEIFKLSGIKFKKAIGICTSAIFQIDAFEKYNLDDNFLKH